MASAARTVLDWLLPSACAGCGAKLDPRAGAALRHPSVLCPACRRRILWNTPREPLPLDPELIERGAAAAWYEGAVETWIRRFKYSGKGVGALEPGPNAIAEELVAIALRHLGAGAPEPLPPLDAVLPIPSPARRTRERGFHPAGNLARVAGALLRRPVDYRSLRAAGTRPSQTGLSRVQRRRNVVGAFVCDKAAFEGARLLLVDDVATTGATLESAARVLRARGVERVFAVCAARARIDAPR